MLKSVSRSIKSSEVPLQCGKNESIAGTIRSILVLSLQTKLYLLLWQLLEITLHEKHCQIGNISNFNDSYSSSHKLAFTFNYTEKRTIYMHMYVSTHTTKRLYSSTIEVENRSKESYRKLEFLFPMNLKPFSKCIWLC